MGFSLLPKEYEFFDMFDNLAAHCVTASKQFQENMNKSIFSEDDVKKIRAKYIPYEKGAHCIAKEFGVSKPTILAIVKNKTWKHI